jgi:hypothetical protein
MVAIASTTPVKGARRASPARWKAVSARISEGRLPLIFNR